VACKILFHGLHTYRNLEPVLILFSRDTIAQAVRANKELCPTHTDAVRSQDLWREIFHGLC